MWENAKPETIVALFIAGIAAIWKGVSMFFKLRSDVDANIQKIKALESSVNSHLTDIRSTILRGEAHAEARHNALDKKLDRLIERNFRNDADRN